MSLGKKIKEARKAKGITQQELAKLIGKGFSTVQKYEIDVIQPPLDVFSKIAEVLGIKYYAFTPDGEIHINDENAFYLDSDENETENEKNEMLEKFDALNANGKKKAMEYIDDLFYHPKYNDEEQ